MQFKFIVLAVMKAYSEDLRIRVLNKYFEGGITKIALAKLYKICDETIRNWVKIYNKNGNCSSRQHLNKGPAYKFNDKQAILDFIHDNPDVDGIAIMLIKNQSAKLLK